MKHSANYPDLYDGLRKHDLVFLRHSRVADALQETMKTCMGHT